MFGDFFTKVVVVRAWVCYLLCAAVAVYIITGTINLIRSKRAEKKKKECG